MVLVTWPGYDGDHAALGGALTSLGAELRLEPKVGDRTPAELCRLAAAATAAVVSTDPFDAEVIAACPRLRVIARVGVGSDSVDLRAATARGVAVTTTPGANEAAVADHTLALMLAVLRRVAEHDASVRRGEWRRTGADTPWELSGATVGLIGYGRVGRLVAARLQGFGARVLFSDPDAEPQDGARPVSLERLLHESDVVSLHTPLLPSTRLLIGRRELQRMRPDAVLVNTARGGVVDEAALVDVLRAGRLRGAGLDVFEREPPRASPLLELGNVVLTPHVGGISERSVDEMTRRATASVVDVLQGRRPRDLANPDVLAHRHFAALAGQAGSR